jgi:hypothetical protein
LLIALWFVKETDWFRGYPEVVAAAVKKAE